MKYSRSEYSANEDLHIYQFKSVGSKGIITKLVQYSQMNIEGYFNLSFGDLDSEKREIDDVAISNNGDSKKVLATVVSTLYAFTGKYPNIYVFATGSNEARTRLYRIGISNNLGELEKDFKVYGLKIDETFEPFIIGNDYVGFLVKRKIQK